MPLQEHIVSIFLDGLVDKSLQADLYQKKHKNINECISDAIDIAKNCDVYEQERLESFNKSSNETSKNYLGRTNRAEDMVELIMQKMNDVYQPEPLRPMPRVDKWCEFEQRWTDHVTLGCQLRIAHMNKQRKGN